MGRKIFKNFYFIYFFKIIIIILTVEEKSRIGSTRIYITGEVLGISGPPGEAVMW